MIAKKKHTEVLKADWDVLFFKDSETGKYRVSAINEDARGKLSIIELASGKPVETWTLTIHSPTGRDAASGELTVVLPEPRPPEPERPRVQPRPVDPWTAWNLPRSAPASWSVFEGAAWRADIGHSEGV